jgi:DNA-nicking Smr family endonuclease
VKRPAGKSGRKSPDVDEGDLWSHAAQSVEPLKRKKLRVHAAVDALKVGEPTSPKRIKAPTESLPVASSKKPTAAKPPAAPAAMQPPPLAEFDRKKVRKLRSGRVDIEARVDLHGLRQHEAHAALIAFLRRCQRKGQSWVLVITGKGKAESGDQDTPFEMPGARDRGVLRRNVPRWLEEPELRGLVVSYATAAIQHGGDGALYVHLRKSG